MARGWAVKLLPILRIGLTFIYDFADEHKDQDVKLEEGGDQGQFMNVAEDTDKKVTSVR